LVLGALGGCWIFSLWIFDNIHKYDVKGTVKEGTVKEGTVGYKQGKQWTDSLVKYVEKSTVQGHLNIADGSCMFQAWIAAHEPSKVDKDLGWVIHDSFSDRRYIKQTSPCEESKESTLSKGCQSNESNGCSDGFL